MGKGDKRRPTHVDETTFARRWEQTFGSGTYEQAAQDEDFMEDMRGTSEAFEPTVADGLEEDDEC